MSTFTTQMPTFFKGDEGGGVWLNFENLNRFGFLKFKLNLLYFVKLSKLYSNYITKGRYLIRLFDFNRKTSKYFSGFMNDLYEILEPYNLIQHM